MKKDLLIAIFTGWFGGYRFYKKEYMMAIVYFFTCGIFGVGWIIDIINASRGSKTQEPLPVSNSIVSNKLLKTIHTKVVGVTYPSVGNDNFSSRQEVLGILSGRFKRKNLLSLRYFQYNGNPAYRVVYNTLNADIGNLSAELAASFYSKYKDNIMIISDFQVTGGPDNGVKTYGCNLTIDIY